MSTLNDTDLFVIERSGTQYQVGYDQMSTLNDTDLFVVEREGVQYKVEAVDVVVDPITGELESPVEVLTPLNGAGIGAGAPYNPISSPIVTVGAGGTVDYETSAITNVSSLVTSFVSVGTSSDAFGSGSIEEGTYDRVINANGGVLTTTLSPAQSGDFIIYSTATAESDNYTIVLQYEGGATETVWNNQTAPRTGPGGTCVFAIGQKTGVTGFTMENLTANDTALCGVTVDGSKLVSGVDVGALLTFTDDTNFDKFQVGDVVQDPYVITAIDDTVPTITTDGGRWQGTDGSGDQPMTGVDNSQNWSSVISMSPVNNRDNAFDNDLNTAATAAPGGEMNVNINNPPSISTLEIYTTLDGGGINMGAGIVVTFSGPGWYAVPGPYPDGTSFSIDCREANGRTPSVNAWRVDGNVAVPQSVNIAGGDATVSKSITYDASLTCSDDSGLINMVGPISMTDENGDLVTPQTSEIVSVSGTAPTITLTFADNTDLEYFSAGDVVQSDWNQSKVWSDEGASSTGDIFSSPPNQNGVLQATNLFDGDLATSVGPYSSGTLTVPFGESFSGTFKVYWRNWVSGETIKDQNDTTLYTSGGSGIGWKSFSGTDVTSLKFSSNGSANSSDVFAIEVNGNLLVDAGITDPNGVSIVSVDAPNSQMVVDGGTWDVSDQSQVWSAETTGTPFDPSLAATSAYDGNLSTLATPANGTSFVTTFSPALNVSTSLRIYVQTYSNAANTWDFQINGISTKGPLTAITQNGVPQWIDMEFTGTLNSIAWNRVDTINNVAIHAVEVDGKLLVDPVYDSQVWSSNLKAGGSSYNPSDANTGFLSAYPTTNVFDGQGISTVAYSNDNSVWVYFTPNTPITVNSSVEFGARFTVEAKINGADQIVSGNSASGAQGTRTISFSGQLTELAVRDNGSNGSSSTGLSYLKIDGKLLIDQGVRDLGDSSISGDPLVASATDVIGVDGNTLQIDGVSGTWKTGLRIKGAEISSSAPSPESVVFTSSNGGSTPVTGTDATLTSRVWTLESSNDQNGPWTVVGEYVDLDANASQNGATPWSGRPALEANKYYQVKVKYTSDNAEPVESVFNTFKTGDAE